MFIHKSIEMEKVYIPLLLFLYNKYVEKCIQFDGFLYT